MTKRNYKWIIGWVLLGSILLTAAVAVAATYSHRWTMQEVIMHSSTQDGRTNRATEGFPDGLLYVVHRPLRHDATTSNCVAITASSVAKTLSTSSDYFDVCAADNVAFLRFGATPTATTTVATGYDLRVEPGQCYTREYEEAKAAVIGSVAGGVVCFHPLLVP